MLLNYLKITLRTLLRNKVYSFINITGLSIGLAAAMLIMLYTKDEVSYDRFHEKSEHIYRIVNREVNPDGSEAQKGGNTGFFQGPRFTDHIPEIQSFVRLQSDMKDIKKGVEIKSQELFRADSNFFSVFSLPLLMGNPRTALKEPHSVVISTDMADRQFGTTNAKPF